MRPRICCAQDCVQTFRKGHRVHLSSLRSNPGHIPTLPQIQVILITQGVDHITNLKLININIFLILEEKCLTIKSLYF